MTAIDKQTTPTTIGGDYLDETKPCENRHHELQFWRDAPSTTRPGWICTTCKLCGKFIGNRPAEAKRATRKATEA